MPKPKASSFPLHAQKQNAKATRPHPHPLPIFSQKLAVSFLTSQQTSLVFRERERELFLDSFSNKSAVSFSVSSLPQTQSQPSIFLSLSLTTSGLFSSSILCPLSLFIQLPLRFRFFGQFLLVGEFLFLPFLLTKTKKNKNHDMGFAWIFI